MTGPGYSDEVAEEGHDLIHNAEIEEQKVSNITTLSLLCPTDKPQAPRP